MPVSGYVTGFPLCHWIPVSGVRRYSLHSSFPCGERGPDYIVPLGGDTVVQYLNSRLTLTLTQD